MSKKINFDNLDLFSDKEIVDFINQKMDEEFQKEPKDIDCDFLKECTLLIRQIQGKEDICISEDVLNERWKNIVSKHKKSIQQNKTVSTKKNQNDNDSKPHKRISIKKLFIIAAVFTVISVYSTSAATAESPFRFINMKLLDTHIDDISPGETISEGNVTVTRADKVAFYSSVQEMVTAEQLYGISCTKELNIEKVTYSVYGEEIFIVISPVNRIKVFSIAISSKNKNGVGRDVPGRKKTTTEKGIEVWEYDEGEENTYIGRYQLAFKINDWYYSISTSYIEKGYELINNFEEITP